MINQENYFFLTDTHNNNKDKTTTYFVYAYKYCKSCTYCQIVSILNCEIIVKTAGIVKVERYCNIF